MTKTKRRLDTKSRAIESFAKGAFGQIFDQGFSQIAGSSRQNVVKSAF